MPFSLKFQRNNQQNALAIGFAKGKTGEKGCIFTTLWDETTAYYDRAIRKNFAARRGIGRIAPGLAICILFKNYFILLKKELAKALFGGRFSAIERYLHERRVQAIVMQFILIAKDMPNLQAATGLPCSGSLFPRGTEQPFI